MKLQLHTCSYSPCCGTSLTSNTMAALAASPKLLLCSLEAINVTAYTLQSI